MGMLIVRPLFYKMASKPFEYLKKLVKAKQNRKISSKLSPLWVETLSIFKSIDRVFTTNSLFRTPETDSKLTIIH
jgi:hypothetical protein